MGMWLCDSTLGPDGAVMKIFEVLGCFIEKYWKMILVKNEWSRDGGKFQFWGYFQSYLNVMGMWLCDSTFGPDAAVMKIFEVLVCFREKYWKVIFVKNELPRGGEKLQFWEYFQSFLKVVGMWLCDSILGPDCGAVKNFGGLGVLERSIQSDLVEKWITVGWGRIFNLENIFKVALT